MNQIAINHKNVFSNGLITINNNVSDLTTQIYVIYKRTIHKNEKLYYLQIKLAKCNSAVFIIYLPLNTFIKCLEIVFYEVPYLHRYKIIEGRL